MYLWPCITEARDSDKAYCTICNGDFSIPHQGKDAVARHIGTKKHTVNAKSLESSSSIEQYTRAVPLKQDVIKAERKFTRVRNVSNISCNFVQEWKWQSLLMLKQTGGECYNKKITPEVITACKKVTQEHLIS